MYLRAEHFDGFSEHLVCWVLEASHGTAIVEASWRGHGDRTERVFEIDFPVSRIKECAEVLAELKPVYDGHVDDFPKYSLSVTEGDYKLSTKVLAGVKWPDEDKAAVDSFMRVWRPLYSDIEELLAIPGRSNKLK